MALIILFGASAKVVTPGPKKATVSDVSKCKTCTNLDIHYSVQKFLISFVPGKSHGLDAGKVWVGS